jgi:hypothetical protein
MISNIRKFKGMPKPESTSGPVASATIDGSFDEWSAITPEYKDHIESENFKNRNCAGWGITYVNETSRNDFISSKVMHDKHNLFFYTKTSISITAPEDKWMTLFIDIDRDKKTGWEGYDYVINRVAPLNKNVAVIERSDSDWNWTTIGQINYAINDNEIELAIPKTVLNIESAPNLNFEFKWADNMQNEGDIDDFLLYGDIAPSARFNYLYKGPTVTETRCWNFTENMEKER